MAQQTERYLKHPILERVGHWVHLLTMVVLILTGFQIHTPARFNLFGTLNTARQLHFVFMYLFIAIGVFHTYRWLISGEWKDEFITAEDITSNLMPTILYYLFLRNEEPPKRGKYNALQEIAYFSIFVLAVIQAVLGFALYAPNGPFGFAINVVGGLAAVRGWHYIINWAFLAFLIIHLYLVFSEGLHLLVAMITGYATQPAE